MPSHVLVGLRVYTYQLSFMTFPSLPSFSQQHSLNLFLVWYNIELRVHPMYVLENQAIEWMEMRLIHLVTSLGRKNQPSTNHERSIKYDIV